MCNISFKAFINFNEFGEFRRLAKTSTTKIVLSEKKGSPMPQYIFKVFSFQCFPPDQQKTIMETFYQISKKKCQYLQSYKHFSFSYHSKLKPTFSMKYNSSRTLETVIKTSNILTSFNIENIFHCLFAVAEGMSYLHSHLINHGNLCPSNIIIDEANQFYLCDFGLYPIKKLYIEGKNMFNIDYKDPCMRNNEPTDKNDIYSFGVLMCELLLPFLQATKMIDQSETLKSFLKKTNKNKFINFPSFFADLISKCLSPFESERPSFNKIISAFETANEEVFDVNVKQLYKKFVESDYLHNLADQDNINALNKLGGMYDNGKDVQKDHRKALEFYKRAADLNDPKAQNNYGVSLQDFCEKDQPDYIEGVRYFQKSAEQGNIHGMANYGFSLLYGDGIEQNIPKAEEYLRKSADLGLPFAQVHFGKLLVENNTNTSLINDGLNYIKRAMSQNLPLAYFTYGEILRDGITSVVEKDDVIAMEYFKVAADLGDVNALTEYARGQLNGIGVPKNEKLALKYYQLAFDKGNDSVKDIIDELTKSKVKNKKKRSKRAKRCQDQSKSNDKNQQINQSKSTNKDEFELPLKISPKTTLISLGDVVYDRVNYQDENYIYPVGYQIEKEYCSIDDPNKQVLYRGTIVDGGESPIFRVQCLDNKKMVFEGNSPNKPWEKIIQAIDESKRKLGMQITQPEPFLGHTLFGLSNPTVKKLIEKLPNAKRCCKYFGRKKTKKNKNKEPDQQDNTNNNDNESNQFNAGYVIDSTNKNEEENQSSESDSYDIDYSENEEDKENDIINFLKHGTGLDSSSSSDDVVIISNPTDLNEKDDSNHQPMPKNDFESINSPNRRNMSSPNRSSRNLNINIPFLLNNK